MLGIIENPKKTLCIFARVYGPEQKVPSNKILLYKTSLLNKKLLLLNKNIMSKQIIAVQNIEQIILLNKLWIC